MNIAEFNEEYENLTDDRKKKALHNIIDLLLDNGYIDSIVEIISEALEIESEDGFGTEGADI